MKKIFLLFFFCFTFFANSNSQTTTNVGTEFWIAFPPNGSPWFLNLFISSTFITNGSLYSVFPGVTQNFTVTPGIVTQLSVPVDVSLLGGIEEKGIHIVSDNPISVYGLNKGFATTDAFLALPVNALGTDYRIITYKTSVANQGTCFSIIATTNGTSLTIYNHQTNSTTVISLNQGQTFHLEEPNVGDDVTGSRIQSNYPVAVFGSAEIVNIPDITCGSADHIVEQLFPYTSWGKEFITVPLAGRDASGDIFRLVSAQDGTDIIVNGVGVATINSGDYYELSLSGYNSISTSNAVLLAQYAKGIGCSGNITGDPFMMLIPPREQFLTNYTIATVAGFISHWINIVAPENAISTIYLDGILIPSSAFLQVGTTNYYGAQIQLNDGSHTLNGTVPFGIFCYGWNASDSYGYPGGCSLSPVNTVRTVTLSPPTLSGLLNVSTLCFTAHVEDNFSNPVGGVLVNFNISGISSIAGYAYTNASGDAQYCYSRTGTVPGTDNIYAECFGHTSTTSTAIWSYTPPCIDPTNAGTIGSNQVNCGSFIPSTLINITLPSGQTGTLEYQWQLSTTSPTNGFSDIAGANSPDYSPGLHTQTTWYRRLARVDCMNNWNGAAITDALEMTVNIPVTPSVVITADPPQVCTGESVTFSASVVNEGISPVYQWKVNGIPMGTNSPVFSYVPLSNDVITCTLTSSEQCTSENPVTSSAAIITVNPQLPVSVFISASSNPFCLGTSVTLTATPVNGGPLVVYQWKVNGINAGTNSPTYTYNPISGDVVICILNSSLQCVSGNPATSNAITLTGIPGLPASVSITANPNPFCPGSSVTFTATPGNGGATPSYQWKVNGVNAGTNSPSFTYNPLNNDSVRCVMTSTLSCVSANPATSNKIILSGTLAPVITFTSCFDTLTTVNAKPIKLKGGIPLNGVYSGPGVSAGIFNPAVAGIGTKSITYTYTNVFLCSASKTRTITIQAVAPFTCGNTLTDIRDGKTYPSVQIGTQCWMAANLNRGVQTSSSQVQFDNCIDEKFCYGNDPAKCSKYGGLYQWDEMMRYDDVPAGQGICPPGWHVPTENDWTVLCNYYNGFGFAGKPLQDTFISGFRALTGGVFYLNSSWSFEDFAVLFWTSTSWGNFKALSHGMNSINFSVSLYPSSRANAFPVRCLLD
ncbi:MAG: FISUMP domain-containing protein [Bacteroidales bacterium]|nr:FISUMP domain-containing protein [Bacteroidales bacterium]